MAKIVGGFLMAHDPLIVFAPDAAPAEQRERVMGAMATIRDRVKELDPTVVIVVGVEHYEQYGPACIPPFVIGIGDLFAPGPVSGKKQRRAKVASHPEFATHIMNYGFENGFDWAVARSLDLDHSITMPAQFVVLPNGPIPIVPVYLANPVPPHIRPERAVELGKMIREAVDSWPGDDRVVVIGTGGISHYLGVEEMGKVSEDFDRRVIDMMVRQDIDSLVALSDEEIVAQGGNGALEIRNLMCAMSSMPEADVKLIAYEPVPEWLTGLGFLEMEVPQS